MRELDVTLADGQVLHAYDTGEEDRLAVLWHHGTPNIGTPPEPLFAASDRLGIRWVAYDRPGYGGSPRKVGRDIASAAAYTAAVADAVGLERFAVMGHSGGGSHALACAALLSDRVVAAVSAAGLAPFDADGLDWFAGIAASGEASLRAAAAGLVAKEAHEASGADDPPGFIPADWDALSGEWSWFGKVVNPAIAGGPGGLVDDDISYVTPWGCDPRTITAPTLLLHGGGDRVVPSSHGEWLARACPTAELRLSAADGHISVLTGAVTALEWLADRSRQP